MILVSSCLLGLCCRYDGSSRPCPAFYDFIQKKEGIVPVCPEQSGGLPTPRPPAILVGGDGFDVLAGRAGVVRLEDRADVTAAFLAGADQCLKLIEIFDIKKALLKSKSPSCGLMHPTGVTAAALIMTGIDVREF